jgi:hypothetical protein
VRRSASVDPSGRSLPPRRRNAAQQAARELADAQAEVKKVQEVRAAASSRADPTAPVTVRALLLAGAFPLVPPEKVPPTVRNPAALYGEFTPVTLLQGLGEAGREALQLGAAAVKALTGRGGGSSQGAEAPAPPVENGTAPVPALDGVGRLPAAAPSMPSPGGAASAAAKPRRQPPPPPTKLA